jgi:type 1 glutamine amidotransferase
VKFLSLNCLNFRLAQLPWDILNLGMTPRQIAALAAVSLFCAPACLRVQAGASGLGWQTNADSVALVEAGKPVWQFHYGTNQATKPFFHPLALPGGSPLTWQSPPDHVWHYGLWFSWKYLNGVNYWEEDRKLRQSEGVTSWRMTKLELQSDYSAYLELALDYRPRGAAQPVLTERRAITISAPAADGSYFLDWQSGFLAGKDKVKFDRTPLPDEPGGQPYGGYAGLSLRFARELTDCHVAATADIGQPRENRFRFTAAAADYSGRIDGREAGVAFIEDPTNPRFPGRWYAILNPAQSFSFLNAAWLQLQPYELEANGSFRLHYLVKVHPGRWDGAKLAAEEQALQMASAPASPGATPRILVFTKNGKGYVHDNIAVSVEAIRKLCAENQIDMDATTDSAAFTRENLKRYKVLVFSNTNNELFDNDEQRAALQWFIHTGGGFVGIHSACGSERQWPWFWSLLGGKFVRHPKLQPFVINVRDRQHPSTAHFGETLHWTDEFYCLDHLEPGLHVLLSADRAQLDDPKKAEYSGEQIDGQSPLAWCHEFEGGRAWYTALGHQIEHYSDPQFTRHILGGILWAMGSTNPPAKL